MKHGCSRVQKSVFVAAFMEKKHLGGLQADLKRLFGLFPPNDRDSVLFVPLREELVAMVELVGCNNIFTELRDPPLMTIL